MAWVHNLDPFAIQFTETFGIRWYGLAYLSGFVFGYYAILLMTRKGATQFKEDDIADFITWVAVGVLAGGRIGYCLFYAPDLISSWDGQFPYWGVLKVNEGGMASHGGILGVLLACYLYARKHKVRFWHCQDLTVFGGSIGFFFGRLANFVNGELYGRPAPETLSWAVKFPQEMPLWVSKEPERLKDLAPAAEALGNINLGGESVTLTSMMWNDWVAQLSSSTAGIARSKIYETIEALILSVQNGNEGVRQALGLALTPRYPSQLIQAVLEGLLVFLVLCFIWRRPQKPGVVAAWFGVLYCSARIVGEQFRMPDAHLGFQWLGLTRGQWLSVAMLLAAISFLLYFYRAKGPRLGGWFPDAIAIDNARRR